MACFHIRPASGTDLNLIYDCYLCGVRDHTSLGRSVDSDIFHKEFSKVIDHVLSVSRIVVACLENEPNVVLGFLIFEPNVVHFIFVKKPFRKLGIAKSLLECAFSPDKELAFQYTTKTKYVESRLRNHPTLKFNPYLLFKKGAVNE